MPPANTCSDGNCCTAAGNIDYDMVRVCGECSQKCSVCTCTASCCSSSSALVPTLCDPTASLRRQRRAEYHAMRRLDHLWGPEPPYDPTAEDKANLFQCFYYGWIGDFIYKAAAGTITEADLPRPTREHRTYHIGRALSRHTHKDIRAAHTWDAYIGSEVKRVGEPETHGWLRWVGYVQQSDYPRALVAGIEWTVAPRNRRHAARGSPEALHCGTVHGERLFYSKLKRCTRRADGTMSEQDETVVESCSCEPIGLVELLPRHGLGAQLPPLPSAPDLIRSISRAHWRHLWMQLPPKLLSDFCAVLVPVLLEYFVDYLQSETPSWPRGIGLVAGVFVVSVVQSVMGHKYDHIGIRAAAVFETSSMALVFEKCLTIAHKSLLLPEMSVGRIMNMVANDVDNVGSLNWYVVYFVSAPLQLAMCIGLLYRLVGWCALSALIVLAVTFPLQGVLSKWQQDIRERMATVTDARIRRTNEMLSGIRIVKFMGWEPRFLTLIERARARELALLKQIQKSYVAFMCVDGATPILVISVVFVLYYLTGNDLTPTVVFPTIALLNIMRIPFFMIPIIVSAVLQCLVSTRRLTAFMECDDSESHVRDIQDVYASGASAAFDDATIRTYMPQALPKYESRATTAFARTMLWFKKRTVPEGEWRRVQEPEESPNILPQGVDGTIQDVAAVEEHGGGGGGGEGEGDGDRLHQLLPKDLLTDVNLIFPEGKLTIIVGATGCGKSTLLGSLLGEYEPSMGDIWATKSIAYVPQQPWIMNATVRGNILFFTEEDPERLAEVVKTCQLDMDLKVLASGLETEIGEKGVNLSGGQKARVSLARAVYANREMYLLDDPLSALDAHVGAKIMEDVILGTLQGKTRVLATHHIHLLPEADHIVVLSHGRVLFSGDYVSYKAAEVGKCVEADMEEAAKADEVHDGEKAPSNGKERTEEEEEASAAEGTEDATNEEDKKEKREGKQDASEAGEEDEEQARASRAALMTVEEKAIGSVPWPTYKAYFRACGGYGMWCFLLGAFLITECVNVLNGVWLSVWSTDAFSLSSATYLYGYLAVVFFGMFSSPIRGFLCYRVMLIGSGNMHRSLLASVGTASVEFFDTTPMGRILNRFTKDTSIVDDVLSENYLFLLQYIFSMLSTIALMTVAQPYVLLAVLPSGFIYYKLMQVYSASNRETRRIASIAHSPVFTLIEESVNGQGTIAVYNKAHVTMQECLKRLDTVYSALYMQNVANRWLGTRLEFVSSVIIAFVALVGVLGKNWNFSTHSVGLVSLSLTMALTLTETLNWVVRQAATVEANMNCVERILHYVNEIGHENMPEIVTLVKGKLAKEEADVVDEGVDVEGAEGSREHDVVVEAPGSPTLPAQHVVSAGSLEFRDVALRYREGLPLVLNGVSFRIARREKVGIVGRTGSGKSTLLLTFMRMVDTCGGEIVVNGSPILSFPLRELRRQFSMIPQDPVLFDGTVRLNVDPFLEASSEEVWHALELCGLRERIASEAEGIDSRVQEGGSNYSVGQRQLLCMARALLKKGSGFILMDEATANIDHTLDKYIQGTVMKAFAEYTVITIAHRLQTVAQYDKIIVMDKGKVAEVGSPRELVSDRNSVFRGMVEAMGRDGAAEFYTLLSDRARD